MRNTGTRKTRGDEDYKVKPKRNHCYGHTPPNTKGAKTPNTGVERNIIRYSPIILWTAGAPHDVTTNLRHFSLSSGFLTVSLSPKPVHSQMLSSHRFLCLPLLLPPCTVPWRNVLSRPEDLVMCPYHCSLRCFTMVKSSL